MPTLIALDGPRNAAYLNEAQARYYGYRLIEGWNDDEDAWGWYRPSQIPDPEVAEDDLDGTPVGVVHDG